MKKKILFVFVLLVSIMFMGIEKVNAEEYNISVEIEQQTVLKMKLNGINNKNRYYIKFEKDSGAQINVPSYDELFKTDYSGDITKWVPVIDGDILISNDWYMLNYNYAYIVSCDSSNKTCSLGSNPIKVEKPSLPELGQRYKLYIFSQGSSGSVRPQFPNYGTNGSHIIQVKIGKVNSNDVLNKFRTGSADRLQTLLDYAKQNDGICYEIKEDQEIQPTNLAKGTYYYIYINYKNDDGMYRDDLGDITIGYVDDGGTLTNDIDWGLGDGTTISPNTAIKNPKTSDIKIIIILLGVSAFASIIFIGTKKLRKINK